MERISISKAYELALSTRSTFTYKGIQFAVLGIQGVGTEISGPFYISVKKHSVIELNKSTKTLFRGKKREPSYYFPWALIQRFNK